MATNVGADREIRLGDTIPIPVGDHRLCYTGDYAVGVEGLVLLCVRESGHVGYHAAAGDDDFTVFAVWADADSGVRLSTEVAG